MKTGSIIIYGKSKCMNTCVFCDGIAPEESLEKKFNKAILDAKYFIDNNYDAVEISGGDPGEFEAIAEVVYYLKKNGIKNVQLSTHGRTLRDRELVRRLSAAGLNYCKIPLYGSSAFIHNKTVQIKNSRGDAFNDTIQAIKNCVVHGIWVAGHTLVTQYNKDDLNNIIKLYARITENHLKEMIISCAGITKLDYKYTGDWYLPFKDMGDYLNKIDHTPLGDVNFKILDIPYCVLGKYSDVIINNTQMPDLGDHEIEERNKAKENPKIPHYRVKVYFDECKECRLKNICDGIHKNDLEMFGVDGLRAIK